MLGLKINESNVHQCSQDQYRDVVTKAVIQQTYNQGDCAVILQKHHAEVECLMLVYWCPCKDMWPLGERRGRQNIYVSICSD